MKAIFVLFLSYLLIVSRLYSLSMTSYFQSGVHEHSFKILNKRGGKKRKISHNNDKKELICQNCKTNFSTQYNLNKHETQIIKIKCNFCLVTICGKKEFKRHKVQHENNGFACEQCLKMFLTRSSLVKHIKTVHFGERFLCPICKESFTQMRCLNTHIKKLKSCRNGMIQKACSSEELMSSEQEKKLICQSCGQIFMKEFYLKRHMVTNHDDIGNNLEKDILYGNVNENFSANDDDDQVHFSREKEDVNVTNIRRISVIKMAS